MNTARAAAAATANITVNKQLITAESAVAQATSQRELMRSLVDQACVVADKASRARTTAHETLAEARRAYVAAIDNVSVATADESQCVAELNAADMDRVAAAKRQLALGAQTLLRVRNPHPRQYPPRPYCAKKRQMGTHRMMPRVP